MNRISYLRIPVVLAASALISAAATAQTSPWEREVVYQIFPRSYCDSNGDHVGDLKGITGKLPFLHRFGITTILINPIFKAREYHNYFADDFFQVDPSLGTNEDFFKLIRRAHRIHMKVILDMEIQYVADRHPWLAEVLKNPESPYASYVWTKGSAFFGMNIPWWGGAKVEVAAINPDNPAVKSYAKKIFRFWAAPNGHPDAGVDGFRIDHMMDDLDFKHIKTGMLHGFWRPIIEDLKSIKPNAFFLAEQADWKLGTDCFESAHVDSVYAFPLYLAFKTQNKTNITNAILETNRTTPARKSDFIFIENHDVERFASVACSDPMLMRLGAVFNLTMKGTPMIYYGQELGMKGIQHNWNSDGNDIPVRLAYRWTKKVDGMESANFYRNTGPWDKTGFTKDNDGISLEEEAPSPDSLFNFYRRLIQLRMSNSVLQTGSVSIVENKNSSILSYLRVQGSKRVLVLLNLAATSQPISVGDIARSNRKVNLLTGKAIAGKRMILPPHGYRIVELR